LALHCALQQVLQRTSLLHGAGRQQSEGLPGCATAAAWLSTLRCTGAAEASASALLPAAAAAGGHVLVLIASSSAVALAL
jgi:hypothetical protein